MGAEEEARLRAQYEEEGKEEEKKVGTNLATFCQSSYCYKLFCCYKEGKEEEKKVGRVLAFSLAAYNSDDKDTINRLQKKINLN